MLPPACTEPQRFRGSRARWRVALALVLVAGAASAGCAARSKSSTPGDEPTAADKLYDVAVGSFHNGMFEDAKLQIERALAADPKHADSFYLRGLLFLAQGKALIDAVEGEQCLEDDAAEQQRRRARELHRHAGESFAAAVTNYPEGAAGRGRALNSLAVVDLQFHDGAKAKQHARAALDEKFYADRYSALANLGWAHYEAGDLVSATSELRQAVLLNPEYCVGRYRLAHVYLEAGLPEPAVEQAEAVVANPRCPIQDAWRILGAARLRLGQDDEAQTAFATCVEVAPRSCLARQCQHLMDGDPKDDRALARADRG